MSAKWTAADVPDQSGRVAIITGSNTGIGYEAAAVLAARGAHVVLAVRNPVKGNDAADRIRATSPNAVVSVQGSRVVTISSQAHRFRGAIDFDDLQSAKKYDRAAAYARSKIANLMFTYELARRLEAAGAPTIATAAHPGSSNTELTRNYPSFLQGAVKVVWGLISQSPQMGALPTLRAATDPAVRNGEYYGPDGLGEQRGHPKRVESNQQSHDVDVQRRLWDVSEELTGVSLGV